MKKNLKKAVALALAALTVSSMSVSAFADVTYGDIDGNGYVDEKDVELALNYAQSKEKFTTDNGSTLTENAKTAGTVTWSSLYKGEILSAKEAATILKNVSTGKTFKEMLDETKTSTFTVLENGVVTVVTLTEEEVETIAEAFEEEAYEGLITFMYGNSPITISCQNTDVVIDALDAELKSSADTVQTVIDKSSALFTLIGKFQIDGVSLATEDGWKALGDLIAQDSTAFTALYPDTVDSDYLSSFVTNLKAAFPSGTDTTSVVAAVKEKNISSAGVTLTYDDTTITDDTEALVWIVENILYDNSKTAADYPDTITITFSDNTEGSVAKQFQ